MTVGSIKGAALALVVVAMGGCLAAAGAGLGAGIYLSDRGAESLVAAPIDQTFSAAQEVFREMGMTEQTTSTEQSASSEERQISGKRGEKNVKVTLRTEGEGTRVEVVASEDMVVWDKDLAKEVLEQIVKKTK
jgi:LDH2 family malate/lactate/ureidoglycolate dehydrogenase